MLELIATVTHVLMIDYLGLINSSHGVLAESVICFSINIRIPYRSPHGVILNFNAYNQIPIRFFGFYPHLSPV